MNGGTVPGGMNDPGAIDVADGLRHRLGHVGSRMEEELHQRCALDVPRFDVVDAVDVQEVVLVIVRKKAFHLRRVHAAIRLGHVDYGQVQAGKDIDGHLANCQDAPQGDADQRDDHGKGTIQARIGSTTWELLSVGK